MIPMIILSLFFMQSMIDKNKKNVTICIVLMFVLPLIFYSFLVYRKQVLHFVPCLYQYT